MTDQEEMIIELSMNGKDYYEIEQKVLESYNLSALPTELIQLINQKLIDYQFAQQKKEQALTKCLLGGAIFLIGISITAFSYLRGGSKYIMAFGMILFGAWTFKEGLKSYNQPFNQESKIPIFKRKTRKF